MTSELQYLTWTLVLTAVMWVPYILDRIAVRGLSGAVGYPDEPKPQSPWARRMMKAHANAVENLVVFAGLVLVAHAVGVSNETTVLACAVYFWARLVHFVAYSAGIPWVRTLSFFAGFGAQVALALQILG